MMRMGVFAAPPVIKEMRRTTRVLLLILLVTLSSIDVVVCDEDNSNSTDAIAIADANKSKIINYNYNIKDNNIVPTSRRDRFPSVEERVKVYMSNWYKPPCDENDKIPYLIIHPNDRVLVGNTTFSVDITPDQAFWMNPHVIQDCARSENDININTNINTDMNMNINTNILHNITDISDRIQFRKNMRMYCTDVTELVSRLAPYHVKTIGQTPLLAQFGDMKTSHIYHYVPYPHFKKFRSAAITPTALDQVTNNTNANNRCYHKGMDRRPPLSSMHTVSLPPQEVYYQPIIWKLATHRHFKYLPAVYREDTPWANKINKAVWRGQLTGALEGFNKELSDRENCLNMFRCKLVYENKQSPWIDALLTTTRGRLPEVLDGVDLVGKKVSIQDLMEYKAIIMLEGNDVASGLKWSLLSQSVVLMPPPKHTSWAMEEKLQPWVHYIPLLDDASDAAEKMEWITIHEDRAKRIAERATMWMEDLVFHPDAKTDDRLIKEEILRRYQTHFRPARVSNKNKNKDNKNSSDSEDISSSDKKKKGKLLRRT